MVSTLTPSNFLSQYVYQVVKIINTDKCILQLYILFKHNNIIGTATFTLAQLPLQGCKVALFLKQFAGQILAIFVLKECHNAFVLNLMRFIVSSIADIQFGTLKSCLCFIKSGYKRKNGSMHGVMGVLKQHLFWPFMFT